MRMRFGNLWSRFRERIGWIAKWISPANGYLVTVCLGVAGILFARAFPSSDIRQVSYEMLGASAIVFVIGLMLRIYLRDESGTRL